MSASGRKQRVTQGVKPVSSTARSQVYSGRHQTSSIHNMQRSIGNNALARLLEAPAQERDDEQRSLATPRIALDSTGEPVKAVPQMTIQPTLKTTSPGDAYELGADQIAEQVTRMPKGQTDGAGASGGSPALQTEHASRERVQTKRISEDNAGQVTAPPVVHDVLRSAGQPLDSSTRAHMESRFGHDLSHVRVHTDSLAAESAQSVNADAYTVGHSVVFGAGLYDPTSTQGRQLLAHEMAHVLQQQAAGHAPARLARKSPQATAPPKPKPQKFSIAGSGFQAVTDSKTNVVTISPTGKSADGWTFVAAGSDKFTASRSPKKFQYVHASGPTEALIQTTTVKAAANAGVTVDPLNAVLGTPPKLSFELSSDGKHAAKKKTETVFSASVERIELSTPITGFVPADGDVIELSLGGGAYVWTTLKPASTTPTTTTPATTPTPATTTAPPTGISTPTTLTTPTPSTPTSTPASSATTTTTTTTAKPPTTTTLTIQGYFDIGSFVKYKTATGFTSHSVSDVKRVKAFEDLKTSTDPARKITAEEATAFQTVSTIESDLAGVQNYDSGILSFGFAQWTIHSDLPRLLKKVPATVFEQYLGRYGLAVGTPVRALDSVAAKFIVDAKKRMKLGVRNASEGGLFLNSKDVITDKMIEAAKKLMPTFASFVTQATAAKTDLTSTDTKKVANAKTTLNTIFNELKGLPGAKQNKDFAVMADTLIKAATDAGVVAKDLVDNSVSEEVLRGPEWVLRFEMLGQDPGGQAAEVAQARETLTKTLALTVSGVPYSQLLRSKRARSALLSSYFNTPQGTQNGMSKAVTEYRDQKVADAKKAASDAAAAAAKAGKPAPTPTPPTDADWTAFPWPVTDKRWAFYTSTEIAAFEAIAIVKVTAGTTDPTGRRGILGAIPD